MSEPVRVQIRPSSGHPQRVTADRGDERAQKAASRHPVHAAGRLRQFPAGGALPDREQRAARTPAVAPPASGGTLAEPEIARARVFLAGGHSIALAGLRSLLNSPGGEGLEVVGAVQDHRHVVAEAIRLRPEVILLGATRELRADLETARRIVRARGTSGAKIVLLRRPESSSQVRCMLRAGVQGCFPLDQEAASIVRAVSVVAGGGSVFLPAPLEEEQHYPGVGRQDGADPSVDEVGLTDREHSVLTMLACGLSNAEIGRELALSVATVKKHLTQAMRKTGQPDRLRAALYAHRQGMAC